MTWTHTVRGEKDFSVEHNTKWE